MWQKLNEVNSAETLVLVRAICQNCHACKFSSDLFEVYGKQRLIEKQSNLTAPLLH